MKASVQHTQWSSRNVTAKIACTFLALEAAQLKRNWLNDSPTAAFQASYRLQQPTDNICWPRLHLQLLKRVSTCSKTLDSAHCTKISIQDKQGFQERRQDKFSSGLTPIPAPECR